MPIAPPPDRPRPDHLAADDRAATHAPDASSVGIDVGFWSGVAVVAVCVALGLPVLVAPLQGWDVFVGPAWWFWVSYGAFLVTLLAGTWLRDRVPDHLGVWVVVAQVTTASLAVLSAAGAGWTAILLVFAAALAGYELSGRGLVVVVGVNVLVVAASVGLAGRDLFDLVFSAGLYGFLMVCTVLGVLTERREQQIRRELAAAHAELRATTVLLAESSRATERLRIARELHDLVGHQLTALALELEVASHQASGPGSDHVVRARGLAKDLLGDVRAAVGELRTAATPIGDALAAVVADLPQPTVHLDVAAEPALRDDQVTALVRCAQEIVTNAIRHAEAGTLWLELDVDDAEVVLIGHDDGRGAARIEPGNGITGMRERVEELGGRLTVTGAGTGAGSGAGSSEGSRAGSRDGSSDGSRAGSRAGGVRVEVRLPLVPPATTSTSRPVATPPRLETATSAPASGPRPGSAPASGPRPGSAP